jgi:hypothetical protein
VKGGVEQVEKGRVTHPYRSRFDEVTECRPGRIVGKLPDAEMEDENFVSLCQEIEDEVEAVWDRVSYPVSGGDHEDFHRF